MTQTLTLGLSESPQTLIDGELPPTLGPYVVRWMESNLVYGPGDLQGEPYKVAPFLKKFLYRLYEYDPKTGKRLVRRAMLGVPKGNSKSEAAAAIALNELAGISVVRDGRPSLRPDPDIPVAAASYEQADIVYGAARVMSEPLDEFLERYDKEILRREGEGRLYRVAAVAGTNDGKRPTTFVADEVHEWVGNTGRVHLVLSNGLAKRRDTLELNITTAGADKTSVAGKLYDYGQKLASGEREDSGFLFQWYEADAAWNLENEEELLAAIRQANPAPWIDAQRTADRLIIDRVPEHEFRRYYLNQWVSAGSEWLPPNSWQSLEVIEGFRPEDGAEIVIGFDGSYNRDATAIYGWTLPTEEQPTPVGFLIGLWETDGSPEYKVPRHEVQLALHEAFQTWQVRELVCDPWRWESEIESWAETYGDVVTEFPTNSVQRMSKACALFYSAVVQGDIAHDGNPSVERHLANAVVKETKDGAYITKQSRSSPYKIDAAVAAIIGLTAVLAPKEEEVWPTAELL